MTLQQAQTQGRRATRSVVEATTIATNTPSINEIPFDYVAKFNLMGRRGNRVQDVINISVEGAFVAVAIAYSFIPALRSLEVRNPSAIASSPFAGYIEPFIEPLRGSETPDPTVQERRQEQQKDLIRMLFQCCASHHCGIHFKYNIVDSGSGRELQNQPIHNISGLGESSGERPFRPFAKPMIFLPRSTIRIEVEEISEGSIFGYDDPTTGQRIGAELYIVLHGYKMLGYGSTLP